MILTALAIERVKPKPVRFELPDSKIIGLRLVVQPSGAKSWAARYRHDGRTRKLTLGPFPRIGLEAARKLASAALRAATQGEDPAGAKSEARRRAQAGIEELQLFGSAYQRYLSEYVTPNLKRSTAVELERIFNAQILPRFKRRRLEEIQPHDIKALCAAQITRGAPVQANKVFVSLRGFFNWCKAQLILEKNPCDGLERPRGAKSRERVLSDQEIRWLWRACDEIAFPFGPMTQLLLLTAARRDEVRSMVWREINTADKVWTIPGKRTKNGREHSIHLSAAALKVIMAIPRIRNQSGFLFTTNTETASSGFSRAKSRIDALMADYAAEDGQTIEPWVIHDLRRTVATGMARLGIALPVVERALNHVSGSFAGIVGVYQKHEFAEERKAAFAKWAAHVAEIVSPAKRARAA